MPNPHTGSGRAIVEKRVFQIPDTEEFPFEGQRATARDFGFRRSVWVPMIREEQVIGVLSVNGRAPGLSDDQVHPDRHGGGTDLERRGWIKSLARPGGNVTGLIAFLPEMGSKRIELVKDLLPRARRIGVMTDSSPNMHSEFEQSISSFATHDRYIAAWPPARRERARPDRTGESDYAHLIHDLSHATPSTRPNHQRANRPG